MNTQTFLEIEETEDFISILNDNCIIYIQKDGSQVSIESEDNGDSYTDCNFEFLTNLRDCLNKVIENRIL